MTKVHPPYKLTGAGDSYRGPPPRPYSLRKARPLAAALATALGGFGMVNRWVAFEAGVGVGVGVGVGGDLTKL